LYRLALEGVVQFEKYGDNNRMVEIVGLENPKAVVG